MKEIHKNLYKSCARYDSNCLRCTYLVGSRDSHASYFALVHISVEHMCLSITKVKNDLEYFLFSE